MRNSRIFAISLMAAASVIAPGNVHSAPCYLASDLQGNTCIGTDALKLITTGSSNTAAGYGALSRTTSGSANTAVGVGSLLSNSIGYANAAAGFNALTKNTTGSSNTAAGAGSLQENTIGNYNTSAGFEALQKNMIGDSNTAVGSSALNLNTVGSQNTAAGNRALQHNVSGLGNTATGGEALYATAGSNDNAAMGYRAGGKQTGSYNTSVGAEAGWRGVEDDVNVLTGERNIAVGYQAGSQWNDGSNNIAVGAVGTAADTATIRIGTQGTQKTVYVAGIFDATRKMKGTAVQVNSLGQLFIAKSSLRYKQDVQPMGDASAALMQLRPVTFRYRDADADGSRPLQYGLIAEEVAKVLPALVVDNAEGAPETVDYQMLPSLLLDAYQKQNRELAETKTKLVSMSAEIAALQQTVTRLTAAAPPPVSPAP